MSDPVLPLLVGIIVALLVLGAVGGLVARGARQTIGFAGAALGGLGLLLALLFLVLGQAPDTLELPIGPPGLSLHLALDPLAAFFVVLVFLSGTAGIAFAAEAEESDPPATLSGVCLCIAGLAIALLAADAVTYAIGISVAGTAIWATGEAGRPHAQQIGVMLLAALSVLAAVAVQAPSGGGTFEAIRAEPGLHSTAAYVLTLLGPAALAGLTPFHHWLVPAHRAAPARAASLLSGAVQPLAVYTMLRLLFDLTDPSPPLWSGIPLLVMGAASILQGGWQAAREPEIDACLAAMTVRQSGLAAIGIGLALIGRAADLPNLTTLALGTTFLLTVAQAVCGTLSQLAAGAARVGAGSRRLTSLGGLVHQMPIMTVGMATGLFGLAAIPAGAGFAGLWLLFQALLAAPRPGGLVGSTGLVLLALVLAASAALATVAVVRLIGVALLGRPRTPRAAAASDITKAARPAMLTLAGLAMVLGVLPGPVLRVLAEPAISQLAGSGLGQRAGIFGLAPSPEATGYQVVPLLLLAGLTFATAAWVMRRRGGPPSRVAPAWNDGFAPPPAWLPFGEPLTQSAGADFVPLLPKSAGLRSLCAVRLSTAMGIWIVLAAASVLLVALAWTGSA